MPEVSASELRQLRSLSVRIVRVEDSAKNRLERLRSATAEISELKAAAKEEKRTNAAQQKVLEQENAALIKELAAARAGLTSQVSELLEVNRDLAERLGTAEGTSRALTAATEKIALRRDKAEAELSELKVVSTAAAKELATLQKSHVKIQNQLAAATAQLTEEGVAILLPPDAVGGLLDDFVSKIDLGGLEVHEGDIRLNVAFAQAGDTTGFVIPTTSADKNLPLHTINLNLTRKAPTLETP